MSERKGSGARIACLALIVIICLAMLFLPSCTNQKAPSEETTTEDSVRAADPMTEEEIEADDSDGCIEDSEDLLY